MSEAKNESAGERVRPERLGVFETSQHALLSVRSLELRDRGGGCVVSRLRCVVTNCSQEG